MTSRITYVKQSNDAYLSRQVFSVGDTQYRVELDQKQHSWSIFNMATMGVVKTGLSKTPHSTKIEVKNALATLGVQFNSESRKKRLT
jgi:hypothetical protein